MNIVYFDCVGGISGDMMVSSLLDATDLEKPLLKALRSLPLKPWKWQRGEIKKGEFRANHINFLIDSHQPHRHLSHIREIIQGGDLPQVVKERILEVFQLLGEAESKAHGIPLEEVHFHEVGADDTILDITAVTWLLYAMKIERVYASPLPLGQGLMEGCHGTMPHPAPALNHLLLGVSVFGCEETKETVTPTGIALLKGHYATFDAIPPMTVSAVGLGGGTRELNRPNMLRVIIGTTQSSPIHVIQLEATVDDMTGQEIGYLWDKVYEAGALDMYITAVQMKKGRCGQRITVLTEEAKLEAVRNAIFLHSTTIGMLCRREERFVMDRVIRKEEMPFGTVRLKESQGYGVKRWKAEFEDLKAIAEERNLSLSEVNEAVTYYYKERTQL
ncbi:MAG: nickel pincer cofactor biosynthesis protein LarC [Bacillota bacterium]|nr:nickel pincer cofactor biosynthesis protein LarC [Bacillota bacterium]